MEPTPTPVNPQEPPVEPSAPDPAAPVASAANPAAPVVNTKKRPKKLMIAAIAAVLVVGGAAAYYFGYHMNSSVIYSQSLKNTGKGYDKLVTYVDTQSKLINKGYTGAGSYKVQFTEFSTDGKIAFNSDGDNGDLTFDVGLGGTRVKADVRVIKSSGTTPDVYVKASDIKGLGTIAGIPELDTILATLDNSWIVIDHTFIDSLGASAAQADSSSMTGPTREQLLDEAQAFGKVNQQYLFSTAKDKAVTKVVKKYGAETVEGHKTYHYKVALQKDNVKKYILAQRDALKASKLNDWLEKNKYDTAVYAGFDDAVKSTKDIDSSDTFDVWMDVDHRLVYKLRFSETKNPANNYADVGLNYNGGNSFPFFIAGKVKDSGDTTNYSFVTTVNTKSGNTNFKLNVKADGSDGGTVTANFDLKPGDSGANIEKPSGAKPLSQLLSELGLTDLVTQYTQAQ